MNSMNSVCCRAVTWLFAVLGPAMVASAAIQFKKMPEGIKGWPDNHVVIHWTMVRMGPDDSSRIAVLTENMLDRRHYEVLILSMREGQVVVEESAISLKPEKEKDLRLFEIHAVDLDKDGVDELVVHGVDPKSHHWHVRRDGRYVQTPPPYPVLYHARLLWFDYDRDGWPDLLLYGAGERADEQFQSVPPQLFHNERGKLVAARQQPKFFKGIDSAQALDVDGDGWLDLITFSGDATRLYFNQQGHLSRMARPVNGFEDFIPLSGGHAAVGQSELYMSGHWNTQLGKGFVTVAYRMARNDAGMLTFAYSRLNDELPDVRGPLIAADLDGDGEKDLFMQGVSRSSLGALIWLEKQGEHLRQIAPGPWAREGDEPLGRGYGSVAIPVDIDDDGLLDFIIFPSESGNKPVVLLNRSKKEE